MQNDRREAIIWGLEIVFETRKAIIWASKMVFEAWKAINWGSEMVFEAHFALLGLRKLKTSFRFGFL